MSKTALELIPGELQGVPLGEADIARAVALAKPTNEKAARGRRCAHALRGRARALLRLPATTMRRRK